MSGHPPPPPSRKPPPVHGVPPAQGAKPPMPGQPGAPPPKPPAGYMPEEEERTGMNPLVIAAIVVGVLVVLVGLLILVIFVFPFLLCASTSAYNINQANQAMQEEQSRIEGQGNSNIQDIQNAAAEQALLVQLTDRLYPLAKVDIGLHWREPDGVRRRRWADWKASKVTDNRYAISGTLDLGVKDVGTQSYKWKCEYTTTDDPKNAQANWVLQTIAIDGMQVYP